MPELIDPRPLEPHWVTDMSAPPSGLVEWSVMRTHWNKELKTRQKTTEHYEGTPTQFIKYICNILRSVYIENTEITIDASQAALPYSISSRWYDPNDIPMTSLIEWAIDYNLDNYPEGEKDAGFDPHELISWLAYVLENNGKCIIDLQNCDPTP